MRRKKCIGVLSCFIAAVCFGTLVVQAAAETSVTNQIETGVIDIELKEYQKDADGDIQPYEDNPVVLPEPMFQKYHESPTKDTTAMSGQN